MDRQLTIPESRRYPVALVALGIILAIVLRAMGRVWWCQVGDPQPWSWDVWSAHNSQHLIDPYSLSHMQHGLGLFLLLSFVASWMTSRTDRGKALKPDQAIVGVLALIVAAVEATWEIVENTPFIINRYRETTVSLDYFGDSILNSVSDYAACLLGVMIASKLNWRWVPLLFAGCEIISLLWIRDSLLLNILMLVYPLESVLDWQTSR